jgi:hypothetical protein
MKEGKIDEAYNTHVRDEKYEQNFGRKTWR